MPRTATILAAAAVLLLGACAGAGPAPVAGGADAPTLHPSQLPPLARDARFPRCSAADLAAAGFPDHMHAWHWPGWQPPVDAAGRPYGPGTLCVHGRLSDRPDLVSNPGSQRFGPWILVHNPAYKACDILSFMEVLDLAQHTVTDLLDLAPTDSLTVLNPDNLKQFRAMGGVGTWYLYRREGAKALIEPIGTLQSRTLDGHAAFMMATDWTLATALPVTLPPWLRDGLAGYLAEDGADLVSYMAEFRAQGPILYPHELVDAVLGGKPDADPAVDRERFRKASYGAFLMTWELVENRGGLDALRSFLHLVKDGTPLDEASRRVYGLDMAGLARSLDPVELGEPEGLALDPRHPERKP